MSNKGVVFLDGLATLILGVCKLLIGYGKKAVGFMVYLFVRLLLVLLLAAVIMSAYMVGVNGGCITGLPLDSAALAGKDMDHALLWCTEETTNRHKGFLESFVERFKSKSE